jgi:hypothetical protein
LQLVSEAFATLDPTGRGALDAAQIIDLYDPTAHPDVLLGARTADAVMDELLHSFDVGGEVDGMVTRAEFINYYATYAASIDNDDYFELLVRAWRPPAPPAAEATAAATAAAARAEEEEAALLRADEDYEREHRGSQYHEVGPPPPVFGKKSDIGREFEKASNKRFAVNRNQSQISFN